MDKEMVDGMRVEVQIYGDDDWYSGTVIKARKEWVQLDADISPYIADENNIVEWRELKPA